MVPHTPGVAQNTTPAVEFVSMKGCTDGEPRTLIAVGPLSIGGRCHRGLTNSSSTRRGAASRITVLASLGRRVRGLGGYGRSP